MDTKTYQEARRKGVPASTAYHWATTPAPPELDWSGDEKATTEREGFDIHITVEPYYDSDTSYLGEFSDTYQPGAIPSPNRRAPSAFQTDEWFIPAYSVEERRQDLSRLGWAKGPAGEEARRQVEEDAR